MLPSHVAISKRRPNGRRRVSFSPLKTSVIHSLSLQATSKQLSSPSRHLSMSRKHGGLSRKDALKSRKGAGNKQDTTRRGRGDDELPAALVIPEDGNINVRIFTNSSTLDIHLTANTFIDPHRMPNSSRKMSSAEQRGVESTLL